MSRFSSDAESAVIGALLIDNTAYDRVANIVTASDFAIEAYRLMYQSIEGLILHCHPADAITVSEDLDSKDELHIVGGLAAIGEIVHASFSAANVHHYATKVRDLSRERAMLVAIGDAHDAIHGTGSTAEKIAAAAEAVLVAAEAGRKTAQVTSAKDLSRKALKSILDRSESGEGGLSLGLLGLERVTGKLKSGQMIVVAGRPGMGKSTLARNIAEHVAAHSGVLFISLEMEDDELGECFIASLGHADHAAIQAGNTEGEHASGMSRGATMLGELRLSIATGVDTIPAIHALARTEARRMGGIGLIVVDYLQQLHVPGVSDRRVEVDAISRGLKRLAMTLRCPVIALSQLSRKVEERGNKRPMLSDLRESGAIEADADKVIFLYRDEHYNPDSQYKGIAEACVAKNRRGKCGKVALAFIGNESRFADVMPGYRLEEYEKQEQKPQKRGFN